MLPAEPPGPAPTGARRIRSVPPPLRGPNLLTTSTAGYDEDANWRRGVTFLWILFGLIALAEACHVAFSVFAGYASGLLVSDLFRVCVLCGVFLTLWFGWNWTRWLLVVFAFLFGAAQLVALMRLTDLQLRAGAATESQPLPGHLLYNAPILAAAVLYLLLAGYLAFASDVPAFTKHRREEGRGWVAVPVALLLAAYVAVLFAVPITYNAWLHRQPEVVRVFGRESLQAVCTRWDLAMLDARCDEQMLQNTSEGERQGLLRVLGPLGPIKGVTAEFSHVHNRFDPEEQRFVLQGDYSAWGHFAHGQAHFICRVTRSLFGPWRFLTFRTDTFAIDPPPVPAATPAASPVP